MDFPITVIVLCFLGAGPGLSSQVHQIGVTFSHPVLCFLSMIVIMSTVGVIIVLKEVIAEYVGRGVV